MFCELHIYILGHNIMEKAQKKKGHSLLKWGLNRDIKVSIIFFCQNRLITATITPLVNQNGSYEKGFYVSFACLAI